MSSKSKQTGWTTHKTHNSKLYTQSFIMTIKTSAKQTITNMSTQIQKI